MRKLGPVAIALGGLLASASYAQTPAGAPPATSAPEDAASNGAVEIIVTAQRRSENLQDTPLAVTAVTAETAQNLGLAKAADIAAITPGANFTVSAGFFSPNIRGLGVAFTAAGLESPVAIYEDGAYLTNTITANEFLDNFDIGSIQVLRGPQGTLYGRNASGGVIIINSADPTDKFEGRVRGEIGNLDHQQLNAMINVPLGQDLALRATGGYKHNGGFIHNVFTGEDNGWEKNYNIRAKLRWTPGTADIILGGEYYDLRNTLTRTGTVGRYDESCLGCVLAPPGTIDPTIGFYEQQNESYAPPVHTKFYGATLKMSFDLDSFQLSSTTTYRRQKTVHNSGDSDNTPLPLFEYVGADVGGKTFSQDLQVTSTLGGRFEYLFGVSYLYDKRHFRAAFLSGSVRDDSTTNGFLNVGSTNSYAAFLEGYYKVTDELKVTVGGRYTYDERGMTGAAFGVPWGVDLSTAQRAFTPRLVLAWDNGPTNLYYSYTRGFKAGGYPDSQLSPPAVVQPEKIASHEIGIKQSMLDNRLRLNAAAFYFKNKGLQAQTIRDVTQGGSTTSNADLENYGVEVEAQIIPMDGLNFGLTGAWQHPRYKPFDGVIGLACFVPGTPGMVPCDPLVTNLTGTAPPQAPTWSGSFSANYEFDVGAWSASLSGLATYRSSINYQPGAGGNLMYDRAGELFLANASGYVSPPGENLRVGFYVNNLFDKKYVTRRQTLVPFGTSYNAGLPRTYGLRVEYSF
ncbi:TonB-dependent receptor [Rhizorhapis suberifaciens]|uniref:Iron complex outermembrane receptor protein n=1 Tax=Rhizorhapis suberifaciens TaxID=13656 RepID=A0A840HZ90_9SPHN|nr:TonB-dependent receptor [Rhizorhapis suberifaciens]MBB4642907.1 iron complex outermembrane receptor protein [Rhizorhapis suberifaciens]